MNIEHYSSGIPNFTWSRNIRRKTLTTYSVMQSDGNSFGGNVISNSFNKTFRDEDNKSDQIYKSKYVRIIFMMILILYNIIRKCILTQQ